jgi:hypothetical protein
MPAAAVNNAGSAEDVLSTEWLILRKSEEYRENARNCAELAAEAKNLPSKNRFKRMQEVWLALAEEQDWLDGRVSSNK